jgi:uncharacterized membrane protein HdeD (DUF308 family)
MFLTGKWWALVLRGIAAIIFGLCAFFIPGITLGILVAVFAAYALVDGIFAIAAAINQTDPNGHWGAMLLKGVVSIIAGIIAVAYPGTTAVVLFYVMSIWAIATGILEIVAAARLRKEVKGEWRLALSGILSVLFGLVLMAYPGPGIVAVLWLIGTYGIVFGSLMIATGINLRISRRRIESELERRAA